ncbi:S8 family peptidase [Chitinophagaceae bacterium MMS25-I14]
MMYQLRVNVAELNIRNTPDADPEYKNWVGSLKKGTTFYAETLLQGGTYDGISQWYADTMNRYYWAGGVTVLSSTAAPSAIVAPPAAATPPAAAAPAPPAAAQLQTFSWFDNLGISGIWSQYNTRGQNVTIAVLDTGYDINNPDVANAVKSSRMFVNDDTNSQTIADVAGHGTFCVSVAAGRDIHEYITGVAPQSSVLAGKISLIGELPAADTMLSAIQWAVDSGADIVSVSFIADAPDAAAVTAFQTGLNRIITGKNVLIFAACGDSSSGQVVTKDVYPASLNGCVSVGASDGNAIADITLRSSRTVIHAQGVDVEGYTLGSAITPMTGTSMSVPIVAGIAALAVSYIKARNNGSWSAADLLQKIYNSGSPVTDAPGKKIINPASLFTLLQQTYNS